MRGRKEEPHAVCGARTVRGWVPCVVRPARPHGSPPQSTPMYLDDRDRLTEFSRNFSESSMYASYVTAWNRVVLCYEVSASESEGRSWAMDKLTSIRNFFRRLFCRNKEVVTVAGHDAEHTDAAAGGAANNTNAASKHDEQLGDHKDLGDDYNNQVARPAQLKSPFTHSLKCGQF